MADTVYRVRVTLEDGQTIDAGSIVIPQGETGKTPNITLEASVGANTGTPTVKVDKSGTAEEPVFSLQFDGLKGEKGANGTSVSVTSTKTEYAKYYSGTSIPTSWQNDVPLIDAGQHLWTKTTVTFSDGKTAIIYTQSYQAKDGKDGATGASGAVALSYSGTNTTPAPLGGTSYITINVAGFNRTPAMNDMFLRITTETNMSYVEADKIINGDGAGNYYVRAQSRIEIKKTKRIKITVQGVTDKEITLDNSDVLNGIEIYFQIFSNYYGNIRTSTDLAKALSLNKNNKTYSTFGTGYLRYHTGGYYGWVTDISVQYVSESEPLQLRINGYKQNKSNIVVRTSYLLKLPITTSSETETFEIYGSSYEEI